MLRASLSDLLNRALSNNLVSQENYEALTGILSDKNHHKHLRSELAMVVFPIRMNTFPKDDIIAIDVVVERVCLTV